MNDRRVTAKHIAETLGINDESVHIALTEILGTRKLFARWVPQMLIPDQKLNRLGNSSALLARFQSDPASFLKRIVTQDETWVHHFDPESNKQSRQWKHVGSLTLKKFKRVPSVGNVMASMFWDCE